MYGTATKRQILSNLKKARRFLSNPRRWIKGSGFADKNGNHLIGSPSDVYAACAWGAIKRADGPGEDGAVKALALAISELHYKRPSKDQTRIWSFNDRSSTTHEQILAAFDKAIENVEAS